VTNLFCKETIEEQIYQGHRQEPRWLHLDHRLSSARFRQP
jgi:hypothetical protein